MKQVLYPLFSSHRDISSPSGSEKHFKLETEDVMARREQRRNIGPNIEHSDSQTGRVRLNLSLSPGPGGLNTSHITTLTLPVPPSLLARILIHHISVSAPLCCWGWSCYCLSELLRVAGLEILISLTVIFDVRRNVTSFKTSNLEYFNILENKILII